jgi:hypothetical protein
MDITNEAVLKSLFLVRGEASSAPFARFRHKRDIVLVARLQRTGMKLRETLQYVLKVSVSLLERQYLTIQLRKRIGQC